ncbi:hypothetical protein P170DRAFT_256674 [Aspergillus steynii IBT 23096]|uniref:Uncharacterized protein n=1 Tax=Aspergillus steynii IBT 23096 TaxID=1392250 RepID=A0A2I2FZ80_9EURO|nr:uncharacterized protein P170DRAFT_256674 [Aspergillus steynii IBT 23096]PLB45938.1 hypothetical protein P170DRAFT_256674 [Aspergillus steynii IBT 23096]
MRMIDGDEGGCWSKPEATWLEGKGSLGLAAHLTCFVGGLYYLLLLSTTIDNSTSTPSNITTSSEFVSPIHSLVLLFPASKHPASCWSSRNATSTVMLPLNQSINQSGRFILTWYFHVLDCNITR